MTDCGCRKGAIRPGCERHDPEARKRLEEIARQFKRDMEKLNLGVSIKAGDGPWVKITDPPEATT